MSSINLVQFGICDFRLVVRALKISFQTTIEIVFLLKKILRPRFWAWLSAFRLFVCCGFVLFLRNCLLWRLNKISIRFGQHKLSILRERGGVYKCQILKYIYIYIFCELRGSWNGTEGRRKVRNKTELDFYYVVQLIKRLKLIAGFHY